LLPTEEERERFAARQNEMRRQFNDLQEGASRREVEVLSLRSQLDQKCQELQDEQRVHAQLERQLANQRLEFQSRIIELKAESDQILEAKLKEARDLDMVLARRLDRQSDNELEEYSVQLRKLRAENSRLEERLRDATEANRCIQRQNEQLRRHVEQLESDATRTAHEQAPTTARRENLAEHVGKLRRKVADLESKNKAAERKFEDLNQKYIAMLQKLEDAQRELPRTEQLLATGESGTGEELTPAPSGDGAGGGEARALRARVEKMKTHNEEMQLRLAKANATVERLNQLLQRKETQLTALQAQMTQMKHQTAAPQPPRPRRI
jgi:chromosome segregation ATPase